MWAPVKQGGHMTVITPLVALVNMSLPQWQVHEAVVLGLHRIQLPNDSQVLLACIVEFLHMHILATLRFPHVVCFSPRGAIQLPSNTKLQIFAWATVLGSFRRESYRVLPRELVALQQGVTSGE